MRRTHNNIIIYCGANASSTRLSAPLQHPLMPRGHRREREKKKPFYGAESKAQSASFSPKKKRREKGGCGFRFSGSTPRRGLRYSLKV
jgi:hypothetical protein